jgi:RNA polymerase sigma factor (sigma-70 family)
VPGVRQLSPRPLDDDQAARAARYVPLALKLAAPWGAAFPDGRDDFTSAALLALCRASRDFRPGGPASFGTYARRSIRLALNDLRRARSRRPPVPQADAVELEGLCCGRPGPAEAAEADDLAAVALASLPPAEADAVRVTVLEGRTLAEAAAALGCCPAAVFKRRARGLAALEGKIRP